MGQEEGLMNDCRECRAGRFQAGQVAVGYVCGIHGVQEYRPADEIAMLRLEIERLGASIQTAYSHLINAANERNETLYILQVGYAETALAQVLGPVAELDV